MEDADKRRFVSVYQPLNPPQAGLIQGALEESGIVCYVNNENASVTRFGGIGFGAAGMAVMVPEDQAGQALQIIADLGLK